MDNFAFSSKYIQELLYLCYLQSIGNTWFMQQHFFYHCS